jgi:hypothetical protein
MMRISKQINCSLISYIQTPLHIKSGDEILEIRTEDITIQHEEKKKK